MHIDGITTCVGPIYAAHLARSLPVWLDTLDSLTVAVAPEEQVGDRIHRLSAGLRGASVLVMHTDAFLKHGAHFNKGAALNSAYAQASPQDWVLSLDCDVVPPPNWRDHLEGIQPGTLYGCKRSDKLATQPWGYFQLWHTSDAQAGPFEECYAHAGRYDAAFMQRWPTHRRKVLPFTVEHLGTPAKHWHGPGNEHLTKAMLSKGVEAYRARDERLALTVPHAPGSPLTASVDVGAERLHHTTQQHGAHDATQ
jgi:hypothetical protein